MTKITGICSHCLGAFKEYHEFFACELQEIKCSKSKEEAYICENKKCKFMFIEDDFCECAKFIFCNQCLNDPEKVRETIENYIKIFGVKDYTYPKIEYKN